jgi:flagellar hook-associated protein 1 FlgK
MMQGRSIPYLSNTGSGPISVAVTGMQQLTSSDYKFVMGSSNSYTLTRKSDNTVVSSGTLSSTFPQTISADGFSMTLSSGTYLAGDQYTISPTANGISNFRVAITDPNKLALAFPVTANANTNNKGTGTASVTSISNIKNSVFSQSGALNPPLSIQFASLSGNLVYNIVNATTGAVIEANIPYNATTGAKVFPTPGGYDPGYCVQLSGSINAGDSFNLVFNSQYATDNRNGLAMAGLYSQQILQNGSLTFTQAYDSLSLYVSEKTNSATQQNHEAKAIKDDADQKRDQISGVSVEEETMNLGEYQQVYQASAQVLQVARTMFDSIMRILEG